MNPPLSPRIVQALALLDAAEGTAMPSNDLKNFRCLGKGCSDRAFCHRFRVAGPGDTGPLTAMYVRRKEFQTRCDQFIDAQTVSE